MENTDPSPIDIVIGFLIAVVYWASNLGALNEGLSENLLGALFALFLYFGGIILLYFVAVIVCAVLPVTRILPGICGGILTVLFLGLFF